MGMFDDVFCERPLPDGWEHKAFQSKDFDCNLDRITICADGRLRRASFDYDSMKRKEPEDMNFHGVMRFYSYEGDPNDEVPIEDRWHEYEAKFTDGQLVGIEVVPRVRD